MNQKIRIAIAATVVTLLGAVAPAQAKLSDRRSHDSVRTSRRWRGEGRQHGRHHSRVDRWSLRTARRLGAGKGGYKDPYAADKPLFTITKANAAQYKDKLSTGTLAMLNKYPNFSMPVYPTRRSACYPKEVYDTAKAEAGKVELAAGA